MPAQRLSLINQALSGLVRGYQLSLGVVLPPSCRFQPSCSQYALQALQKHDALTACRLAAQRICRCHPLNPGGFDPVP